MPTIETTDNQNPAWGAREPLIVGATDIGVVRRINQDAFGRFDDPERGEILLVVADGLGGHLGGEIASQMAVEWLGKVFGQGDEDGGTRLTRAISQANERILAAARRDENLDGMGTTIVCLLLAHDDRSFVAHVGDSRLYRLRNQRIATMTEDHSLVATLVREGILTHQQARNDPRRNQILRALGVREDIEIDVAEVELAPGDLYLLCSDGLHGLLEDKEIARLSLRPSALETAAKDMIDAANEAGGTDNVTCMLARIPDPDRFTTLRTSVEHLVGSTVGRLRGRRST